MAGTLKVAQPEQVLLDSTTLLQGLLPFFQHRSCMGQFKAALGS
jgi:hypothetical protein